MAGPEFFAAVEFTSDTVAEDEVRVVLNKTTTNVLWPLPGRKYRWTFQLTHSDVPVEFPEKARRAVGFTGATDEHLRHWVQSISRRRAPWFSASVKEIVWCTQVTFEHQLAKRFGQGRCWLAGDAAHQTSPVGMQSMNVGLCEAESLARALQKILREDAPLNVLATYERERQSEWRRLLGLSGGLKARRESDPWVRERCGAILSCIPCSGEELPRLAEQLGLEFAPMPQFVHA